MILPLALASLMGCNGLVSPGKTSIHLKPMSLEIKTVALPAGTVKAGYTTTLAAVGGLPPYFWSTVGPLPAGLSLNSHTGTIAGAPNAVGAFSFTTTVKDSRKDSVWTSLSISVSPASSSPQPIAAPLRISTTGLPVATVQSPYSATLNAIGGVPPYSWTAVGGQFPGGLKLNSASGAIAGQPTSAGNFSFEMRLQDSAAASIVTGFSLNVSTGAAPVISAVSPSNGLTEGATLVTISGSNLIAGTGVKFGLITASSVQVVDASHIQAVTPAESTGAVNVVVEDSDGQVATAVNAFRFELPAPVTSPPSTADVVVDASQPLSETGGDDLAAAKNIFASASAPESNGGLSTDWDLISSEFVMKRMRNINGLGDCAIDSDGHLSGCSRLNGDLAVMKSRNLIPHIVVGQWEPASIGGNALQWGPTEWAKYDALCYAIVNYVVNQYGGAGFNEALFEVGNELDTTTNTEDLWLTPTPNVPQGDPSRFMQYDTVYAHWASAVDLVAKQNSKKRLRIAGPATGSWTAIYGSGPLWHTQLVKDYAAKKIRLDVVSLHVYGSQIKNLAQYGQDIRTALVNSGNSNAEIWVTEWGASDLGDSVFGGINGSHVGAAWAIDFLLQALKGTITGGSFLEVRDNEGPDTAGANADLYMASWNHIEKSIEYPKAIANSFSMVEHMSGTRRAVVLNPAKPDLYALSSSDSTSASVIVANYNYTSHYPNKVVSDLSKNETVTVEFKHLPFNGPVTIDRYLIDANTSNLNYWLAAGKTPPSVQSAQLQKVESISGNSVNGMLTMPATELAQSAVTLWIAHK
jgi:hypothetical protein